MELFFDSTFGRIIIYSLAASSLLVAIYLIFLSYKLFKNYYNSKSNNTLIQTNLSLFEFKSVVNNSVMQLGFSVSEVMKVIISIIDKNDKLISVIYDKSSEIGDNVFLFDTTLINNGSYFLNVITKTQNISRIIIIDNS